MRTEGFASRAKVGPGHKYLKVLVVLFLLTGTASCFFKADTIDTEGVDKDKVLKNAQSKNSGTFKASLTKVSIINDQIILEGIGLDSVDTIRITGPSGLDETFSVESKTNSKIIANGLKNIAFLVGSLFELTVSNAFGAATFQVTFTLQDGAVTASKLSDMGASVGQVLKYDGTTWVPSDLSALTYAGNWDANTNTPDLTAGGSLGEYYIVSSSGTTNLFGGTGTDSWAIGDWAVWNNVAARWEKIDNATNVTSFNGRNGPVSPQAGDYSFSQIANGAGVYLDYQPANTACSDGQVLKYDSTIPGWKCDNDIDTTSIGDITGVNAGVGLINGGLSGDITIDVNVGTGANQIPQLDGSGVLAPSTIPNLDTSKFATGTMATARLPYASGATDGILSAADYTTLSSKEGAISAGTTAQYYRGDKTWVTLDSSIVPENTNLYFTNTRAQTAVVSPLISDGVTNLSPSEDAVFDALALKQDNLTSTTNASVGTVRIYDSVDQSNYVELNAPPMAVNQIFTLPGVDGTSGQVLSTNGTGSLSWVTPPAGTVTSVTATAPLASTGGATPNLTLAQATSTTNGFLSSTDWNTFNNKQTAITAGTTAQYWRGDKSWQALDTSVVPENTNLYFTNTRAKTAAVADTITDAITDVAPSQNAVFDALALKKDATSANSDFVNVTGDTMTGALSLPSNGITVGTNQLVVSGGKVGVGTGTPSVELDVSGTMRLSKNTSQPYTCDASKDGAIALTNLYTTCICRNGVGWVTSSDGSTTCLWDANTIVTNGSSRNWRDGTFATSCNAYRNPTGNYVYSGNIGDGLYTIDVDGPGGNAAFDVFCDMTTEGGGWTLVLMSREFGGSTGVPGVTSSVITERNYTTWDNLAYNIDKPQTPSTNTSFNVITQAIEQVPFQEIMFKCTDSSSSSLCDSSDTHSVYRHSTTSLFSSKSGSLVRQTPTGWPFSKINIPSYSSTVEDKVSIGSQCATAGLTSTTACTRLGVVGTDQYNFRNTVGIAVHGYEAYSETLTIKAPLGYMGHRKYRVLKGDVFIK